MNNKKSDVVMLNVGFTLHNTYRIDGYLSSGGFGNTYKATNIQFGETVAIKEFFMHGINQREKDGNTVSVSNSDNKVTFGEQKEKFKKEAKRLRKLHSENIVQVHDLFEENGTVYYVMDFIDGHSLAELLKTSGKPLDEEHTLKILGEVLSALEVAHNNGIYHLDLKPANIMVDKQGKVKLIDFGASKQQSATGGATATSAISYTNGYAPREQMEQNLEKFGPWTDFYALGATLYNLLTNKKPPLPSDIDDDTTEDKHLALPIPKTLSSKTRMLVLWLLSTNRHQRPQSVKDIRDYLNGALDTTLLIGKNSVDEHDDDTLSLSTQNDTSKEDDIKGLRQKMKRKKVLISVILLLLVIAIVTSVLHFGTKGNGRSSTPIALQDSTNKKDSAIDSSAVKDTSMVNADNSEELSKGYVGTDAAKIIREYLNSSSGGKYTPPFDVFYDNSALREDDNAEYSANNGDDKDDYPFAKSYTAKLTLNGKSIYGGRKNIWYINLKGPHAGAFVLDLSEEGGDDNLKTKDNLSRALGGKLMKKREEKQYDMYYYLYKVNGGYLYINYLIGGGAVWLNIRVSPYLEYVQELYDANEEAVRKLNEDNS